MNDVIDKDFLGLEKLNEYLKTNFIRLECDSNFRIRTLNYKEKSELNSFMHKIKNDLISDESVRTEKQLIASWKIKGKDIDKMTSNFKRLERLYWRKMNDLGKLISKQGREDLIKELESEIKRIRQKQSVLNFKKTDLLASSYELQYLSNLYKYASYLALERNDTELDTAKDSEKWVKAFTSLDEFDSNVKEEVANEALTLIALVESHAKFQS